MPEIDDLHAEAAAREKARADKAEAEVEDYKQKVETLLSALRGEQGIVLDDGIVLHPCAERNAEKARADKAEAEVERLTAEVDDKSACAKCGCPQDKHHSTKPRLTLQDRPDVESYCDKCGVEDCWHFTGHAPAPDKSACGCGPYVSCEQHEGDGKEFAPAPAPPASETSPHCECCRDLAEAREEVRRIREGFPSHGVTGCVDRRVYDHDTLALRAEVERLRENADPYSVVRASLKAQITALQMGDEQRVRDLTRHIQRADKAEAERDKARSDFASARALMCAPWNSDTYKKLWDAEARVAHLEAALREIAERHIPTYPTDYEWMRGIANDHRNIARAALEGK